jgi:hypothetical protein
MTFSKTPIEAQLQRNSSIILKQRKMRPPERQNSMPNQFEVFRNNSLLQNTIKNKNTTSFNKIRRHSSELLVERTRTLKLPVRF